MNVLLNTPVITPSTKDKFDNTILMVFLIFLGLMVFVSFLYINVAEGYSKNSSPSTNIENQPQKTIIG